MLLIICTTLVTGAAKYYNLFCLQPVKDKTTILSLKFIHQRIAYEKFTEGVY